MISPHPYLDPQLSLPWAAEKGNPTWSLPWKWSHWKSQRENILFVEIHLPYFLQVLPSNLQPCWLKPWARLYWASVIHVFSVAVLHFCLFGFTWPVTDSHTSITHAGSHKCSLPSAQVRIYLDSTSPKKWCEPYSHTAVCYI